MRERAMQQIQLGRIIVGLIGRHGIGGGQTGYGDPGSVGVGGAPVELFHTAAHAGDPMQSRIPGVG